MGTCLVGDRVWHVFSKPCWSSTHALSCCRGVTRRRAFRTLREGAPRFISRRIFFFMAQSVTVLVVEPDQALQRQLQHALRARYTVLTASCWTQAREIRARSDVDVVVAD